MLSYISVFLLVIEVACCENFLENFIGLKYFLLCVFRLQMI